MPRTTLLGACLLLAAGACSDPSGPPSDTRSVVITSGPTELRQGDVAGFGARVAEADGTVVPGQPTWSMVPASAGFVTPEGRVVGYAPGVVRVVAASGGAADTATVTVMPREGPTGGFTVVGWGTVTDRFTSDLWLAGEAGYSGTWGRRDGPQGSFVGNTLYVWDLRDPAAPLRADSVTVDAATVNDVKVRADGGLVVLTHEGSADGRNGITLLDATDPFRPVPVARFTEELGSGVHNVWVEDDHVYVVTDGAAPDRGLRILDASDPAEPRIVAAFYAGESFLHDVYVRDGLAFLSHWDAGLVILDVGAGLAGGSPESPVEVSRIMPRVSPTSAEPAGQVHNAWYWPDTGYVFVGEEDFQTPGRMHVIDASAPATPRHVASFRVEGATPHNFWLDEERGILYAAWYAGGLRAIDVTGELLGDLDRQGREIAFSLYDGVGPCPPDGAGSSGSCTWAPQLHGGLVWVSDMKSGLWALAPDF